MSNIEQGNENIRNTSSIESRAENPSGEHTSDAKEPELESYINLAIATRTWIEETLQLALLELRRSTLASAQVFGLAVYGVLAVILLYVSCCIGIAWTAYDLTHSAGIASLSFIAFQFLAILALHIRSKHLKGLIGFKNTKQEIEAMINEFRTETQ